MKVNVSSPLSDGTKLCLECGLCCTGIFHDRAILYTKEDKKCAETFGATFVFQDNKEWFRLPCPVYEGKCSIYPNNPSVCQKHECNLLKSVSSQKIELEKAIKVVHEMKEIIQNIENDLKTFSFETDKKEMTFLFKHFFDSIPKTERKNFGNLLKEYASFLHLKKKYFYE